MQRSLPDLLVPILLAFMAAVIHQERRHAVPAFVQPDRGVKT